MVIGAWGFNGPSPSGWGVVVASVGVNRHHFKSVGARQEVEEFLGALTVHKAHSVNLTPETAVAFC